MRSATFPPIRVEPKVRAEVEAVLREGESLIQFIEEAVVAAAAWRRVQGEFDLQKRLDGAKRRAAQRKGR